LNFSVILSKEVVAKNTVTLKFSFDRRVYAGQFAMVWAPGKGEIPISFSHTGDPKGITIKNYGDMSAPIVALNAGERIFFRGPYGNSFTKPKDGDYLLIGGGSGIASLAPLISKNAHGIISARSMEDLFFLDKFEKSKIIATTDDGSFGIKGNALDALRTLDLEKFQDIYVCGPEKMMKGIYDYIRPKNIAAEFSLERPMKCAIGVCDSCSVNGIQICKTGPVFGMDSLRDFTEFGTTRLLLSGKRVNI